MDDASLLERWRDGDRQAGNQLIAHHHESVFTHAYHRLDRDRETASDIVQDAFMVLVTKHDPVGNVRSYLRRIVDCRIVDHWRRQQRWDLAMISSIAAGDRNLSSALDRRRGQELLVCALRSLSEEDQRLLRWFYDKELRQPEIAARLCLGVGQVNGRIARARERLRRRVAELEGRVLDSEKHGSISRLASVWRSVGSSME